MKRNKISEKKSKRISPFPIIVIGGSTGSLNVFIKIIENLPKKCEAAIIYISHHDPKKKSLLEKIISDRTTIPVSTVTDKMKLEAGVIYIPPPDKSLQINDDIFILGNRLSKSTRYFPIDYFISSLAKSHHEKVLGILLSGDLSDGAEGLKDLAKNGGYVCVQDPGTAEAQSMPQSAIDSASLELILPPEQLSELVRMISEGKWNEVKNAMALTKDEVENTSTYQKIFSLILEKGGPSFIDYKQGTIQRRIQRRLDFHSIELADYAMFLETHPDELKILQAELLIHVTAFFRDPTFFQALKDNAFNNLIKNSNKNSPIRIWVAGCATGEEAYSIAISLLESLDEANKQNVSFQIIASDLSQVAINTARVGIYNELAVSGVSPERLEKYFSKVRNGFQVNKSIRDYCLFARHDLTENPPFSRMDLITCRNVLIYFSKPLQQKCISIFNYALNSSGYLGLGKSEKVNIDKHSMFVEAVTLERIYLKNKKNSLDFLIPQKKLSYSFGNSVERENDSFNINSAIEHTIAKQFSPPCILINEQMEIIQFRGDVKPFLSYPTGQASLNLLKVIDSELRIEFRKLFASTMKTALPGVRNNLIFKSENKNIQLALHVVPVEDENSASKHYLVFFQIVNRQIIPKKNRIEIDIASNKWLEQEYFECQENAKTLFEKFEFMRDSFLVNNEELQSSNEELQSSNEELETAKEELQISNQELTSLNDKIEIRNKELDSVALELFNFHEAVDVPVIKVEKNGEITRFNKAAELISLNKSLVVGKNLNKLLPEDAFEILLIKIQDSIISNSELTFNAKSFSGKWQKIKIKPFYARNGLIDGAIIVILDIDEIKRNYENLKEQDLLLNHVVESVEVGLWIYYLNNKNFWISQRVNHILENKIAGADYIYSNFLNCISPEDQVDVNRKILNGVSVGVNFRFKNQILMENGSIRWIEVEGKPNFDDGLLFSFVGTVRDITDLRQKEIIIENHIRKLNTFVQQCPFAIAMFDSEMRYISYSQSWSSIFETNEQNIVGRSHYEVFPNMTDKCKEIHQKCLAGAIEKSDNDIWYRADGSVQNIRWEVRPWIDANGIIGGIIIYIEDITSIKNTENELRMAIDSRDEFLSIASHELRTPLAAIYLQLELLSRLAANLNPESMNKITLLANQSFKSAKQLNKLLNGLLDITNIRAGKLSIEKSEVNLGSSVKNIISQLEHEISNSGSALDFIDHENIIGFWDQTRIDQIIINLLTNALKYGEGKKIEITIDKDPIKNRAKFLIKDHGMGIKSEMQNLIFQRFERAVSVDKISGLGLGLYIVQKIVDAHGGSIKVESTLKEGALFTVELPIGEIN